MYVQMSFTGTIQWNYQSTSLSLVLVLFTMSCRQDFRFCVASFSWNYSMRFGGPIWLPHVNKLLKMWKYHSLPQITYISISISQSWTLNTSMSCRWDLIFALHVAQRLVTSDTIVLLPPGISSLSMQKSKVRRELASCDSCFMTF